ncbi:MAG: hypothetical protein EXX96DRAFT_30833 [Benjaminiella poitrasii]|nr:MAG: hypothetical protein EXX96DRAFT_30833 [Benjaminiella poitrasii]
MSKENNYDYYKPKIPHQPDIFSIIMPGITPEAAQLSTQLLMKNNKEFHCFFNDKKFHNHLIHHLLAAYSLGANKETLQEIFDIHAKDQRPLPPSAIELDRRNYHSYLGKASSYTSFLNLFRAEIEQHGALETVREWVWSGDMLARTIGGAYHPFIHIGYGLEFDVPAVVAEGLAMAACTEASFESLVPHQPPLSSSATAPQGVLSTVNQAVQQLSNQFSTRLGLTTQATTTTQPSSSTDSTTTTQQQNDVPAFLQDNTLFEILIKVHKDPVFDNILSSQDDSPISKLQANPAAIARIKSYVDAWVVDNVQERLKELYGVAVLALGATAMRRQYPGVLRLDFFLMHALTSSEFLHQFLFRVGRDEAVTLLRAHAAVTIFYYVTRGRPRFDVQALLEYESAALRGKDCRNGWLEVFAGALKCKEPHVIKVVRACAVAQVIYGPAQDPNWSRVWLHVAQMAVDKDGHWDFNSLGFDDTWSNE